MQQRRYLYPVALLGLFSGMAEAAPKAVTPIEHVIVIVGENRSFDNLFATYKPKPGQAVWNLLSRGIVREDGKPGKNFGMASQKIAQNYGEYSPTPKVIGSYDVLPQPYAWGAFGQRHDVPDARFPADLPNGPFPITQYVGYGAHTGDPLHRFFQMWQQVDGGKNDLFVWTTKTAGIGPSNGKLPISPANTYEGSEAMGFYNMAQGDAPYWRELADQYAIADNYHQAIMGGTAANYLALVTADAAFYTRDGKAAKPPAKQIENPDAQPNTNNWYTEDGYGGGSYVNCADNANPGVKGIKNLLSRQPYKAFHAGNCDADSYYMAGNMDPGFSPAGEALVLGDDKFLLPPQIIPTIGDAMTAQGVSWKWYAGGRNDSKTVDKEYCAMCDPLTFFASTMRGDDKNKLQDLQQFYVDAGNEAALPAVSFISTYDSISGHPGYAMEPGFDELLRGIVNKVKRNPELWKKTAILVTFDEGGGYYDSGYVQFIDFFGDGTRVPLLAISPYAKRGHVDHTYFDHASIVKFIEKNWGMAPLSARSRDNLPNPVLDKKQPYVPLNRPAIGDLMSLFDFGK
jgi:acid phosphatase